MGRRRVRLQDIAERVGVSVATVSLVLNDKALAGNVRISEGTIRAVKSAALEMGYLQGGMVGLIVPWIWDSVETPMIEGITRVFRTAHYNLAMGVMTTRNPEVELEEIRAMDTKGFDSIIFEPSFEFMEQPDRLREWFGNWKRVVLVNQFPCDVFPYVTVNQERCGYLATQHLLELGHRHIACIRWKGAPGPDPILKARYEGYVKVMREYELRPLMVRNYEKMLDDLKDVTAVYCTQYRGAADLLGSCVDRGILVPDDLSVVGIADDREKLVVRPKLTTVDIQAYEMGVSAAQMVLDLMEGRKPKSRILEPKLIVRDSARPRV